MAESRKNLVDEMAIDKQTADTNHREHMDKMQEEHKVRRINSAFIESVETEFKDVLIDKDASSLLFGSARKHVTSDRRRKTYDWQARENMWQVPSAGKHVASAKRGKHVTSAKRGKTYNQCQARETCNQCQARENM